MYQTQLSLHPNASLNRVRLLIYALNKHDITVKLEPERTHLQIDIPERAERWILLGGLAALIEDYSDVIHWTPHFYTPPVSSVKALSDGPPH